MKTITTLLTGTALTLFLSMVCSVYAQDVTVSEKSFTCIRDGHKIRNTYIRNADPEKLKEAVRIFKNSVPDKEYPVGTILQLVPFEAMVKHPREKFPKSNGWEFFALEVSEAGTKIRDRGDNVVNLSLGAPCLSCHQPAARFDFVCEKGRSEEHTSELQSPDHLVCRLLLEKKKI